MSVIQHDLSSPSSCYPDLSTVNVSVGNHKIVSPSGYKLIHQMPTY